VPEPGPLNDSTNDVVNDSVDKGEVQLTNNKEEFIRKFNTAFENADTDFILDSLTDDLVWTIVGSDTRHGKSTFADELKKGEGARPPQLTIHNIITHGDSGVMNGIVKVFDPSGESKTYAVCDIYRFRGFKNPKIREITTYMIEVEPEKESA
jgi:ketosteroid isomerase-like protein